MKIPHHFFSHVCILCSVFLFSEQGSTGERPPVKRKGSSSVEIHCSTVNLVRAENRQPHPWLNGFRGGPNAALRFRWSFRGGFSLYAGYHVGSWTDRRSWSDRLCDVYLVCITNLPLKLEKYGDRCVHHGFMLGTAWEFPEVFRVFRPVFSMEFGLDRIKYTTQVCCEYISPLGEEQHLFEGASRLQSHYSPGIGIGMGFQFSIGRIQLIPEVVYSYSALKVSYLGFDEWMYTHVWLEGWTRYTYHYRQGDTNHKYDNERFNIEAFEFRMTCRLRL